jgi:hypothetical protein
VNRSLPTVLAAAFVVLCIASSAEAGPKPKPKPKPIRGSYTVTLPPKQPQLNGSTCDPGITGQGQHRFSFTIPGKGTLRLVLDGQDPLPMDAPVHPDWALALRDASGEELDSSDGETAHEVIVKTFKGKQNVQFQVCNLRGLPQATVSYVFTYA